MIELVWPHLRVNIIDISGVSVVNIAFKKCLLNKLIGNITSKLDTLSIKLP